MGHRRLKKNYTIFLCLVSFLRVLSYEDKPLVIITASYNNEEWVEKNLTSLFTQRYTNWRLIYTDDNSIDSTVPKVKQLIDAYGMEDKVTLIQNKRRRKHLANQYTAIHSCAPHEIIVILDGDDWLSDSSSLARINEVYNSGEVWLTWGQFWYLGKNRKGICKAVPESVLKEGRIRQFTPWCTSHVRTFYAGLFQQIPYGELQYQGEFFPMCADVVTMFAMIEMAGDRVRFIPDVLYIYNDTNTLSFYHDHMEKQRELEKEIRARIPYTRLDEPPF